MYFATGELPYQPGINGTKSQFSFLRFFAGAFYIIEYPADLGGRKIGVHDETRLFLYQFTGMYFQLITKCGCTTVLPYNSVMYRCAGFSIPHYGRLALVGNTNGCNIGCL